MTQHQVDQVAVFKDSRILTEYRAMQAQLFQLEELSEQGNLEFSKSNEKQVTKM